MLEHFEHLSIWEISHRWHEEDPSETNKRVPIKVQDTIRIIVKAIDDCEITICNHNGIERRNPKNFYDFGDFVPPEGWEDDFKSGHRFQLHQDPELNKDLSVLAEDTGTSARYDKEDYLWDMYYKHQENWGKHHIEAANRLIFIVKNRSFDYQVLESIHINQQQITKLCRAYSFELPSFWFTHNQINLFNTSNDWDPFESDNDSNVSKEELIPSKEKLKRDFVDDFWNKLEHKQKSRLLSREAAKVIWKDSPKMTIAAMVKDELFLKFSQSEVYAGKNTKRDWIKDLNPNINSGGRPKKTSNV